MAKKYIDAEKLKAEVKRYKNKADERLKIKGRTFSEEQKDLALQNLCGNLLYFISSLQQEQPEENNLPSKRTRVNYAICKLQSFKPLREAIVLDDYVYDEGKCYRENLLNYIHAIPENRLKEIRHYLQEKGWWPYDDDADWMEQEQPEVDLEKEQADLFTIVALDAAQRAKEQMMKEAVEGTVMDFSSNRPRPQVDVLLDPHKYHTGDKVRIIIVKEEDRDG